MDINEIGNPIIDFVVDVTTKIMPVQTAKMLHDRGQLSHGKFSAYIGAAILFHWSRNRFYASMINVNFSAFRKLCLKRIRYVLRHSQNHEGLKEMNDFAKYLTKPKKFISIPKSVGKPDA